MTRLFLILFVVHCSLFIGNDAGAANRELFWATKTPVVVADVNVVDTNVPDTNVVDTNTYASSITQFGITWTFDSNEVNGVFANGDNWVVGPVNVISIDPCSFTTSETWIASDSESLKVTQAERTFASGVTVNGSMLNPTPDMNVSNDRGRWQGYISTLDGFRSELNVAAGVNNINVLTVPVNSSLVSTISKTYASGGNYADILTAAILTVVASAPDANSFRPAYCSTSKISDYNIADLNGQMVLLGTLAPTVTEKLDLATVEGYFARPWLDHKDGAAGRTMHPYLNMPDYGRDISTRVGIGSLHLQCDYTNVQKMPLLVNFVQLGIDNYGIIKTGGISDWGGDGGQAIGRKWPILFAGIMLNDANMKAIGEKSGDYLYTGSGANRTTTPETPVLPIDYVHFGEDDQTFYVTQDDVNIVDHSYLGVENIGFAISDLNRPSWGIAHYSEPAKDGENLNAGGGYGGYVSTYFGWILSANMMNAKTLWNHNAVFDMTDRFRIIQSESYLDEWTKDMWDAYRANYGCVWTPLNANDANSNGSCQ